MATVRTPNPRMNVPHKPSDWHSYCNRCGQKLYAKKEGQDGYLICNECFDKLNEKIQVTDYLD